MCLNKRDQEKIEYKTFKKPHFGPEDSPEKVIKMMDQKEKNKERVFKSLRD